APGRLFPGDHEGWILIRLLRIDPGFYAWNRTNQRCDALHSHGPFLIERVHIHVKPRFNRGKTSDNFFLADFHRAAHRTLPGARVREGCIDKIFPTEKKTAALWTAK